MKCLLKEHPIRGGLLAIVLAALFCYVTPLILAIPVFRFIVMPLKPDVPSEALGPLISQFTTVVTPICAIIYAIMFAHRNRRNGYNGPVKFFNGPDRELWIVVAIYVCISVLRNLIGIFTTPDGWQQIDLRFHSILTPVMAGITEEVIFRLIPLSLMLRYHRDSHHLKLAVIWTSFLFGAWHLTNGIGVGVVLQSFFAVLMGFFFAAAFLRTGSVVLPALLHFFLDFTVMTIGAVKPEAPELHILILFAELVSVALGIFLLRKKKHAEIFTVLGRAWPVEEEPGEE